MTKNETLERWSAPSNLYERAPSSNSITPCASRRPRATARGSAPRRRRRRRGAAVPTGSRARRSARTAASCGSGSPRRPRRPARPPRSTRAPANSQRLSPRQRRGCARRPAASTARGTRRSRASPSPPARGSAARASRRAAHTPPPPRGRSGTPSRRLRARARSRCVLRCSARGPAQGRPRPARCGRPQPPRAPPPTGAPMPRPGAPRACGRAGRAGYSRSGGADCPSVGPFMFVAGFLPAPRDSDRREGGGLFDRDLAGATEIEEREERHGLLDARELPHLLFEVEARTPPQHGAEPLEELRHGREAQRHVLERDLRRLDRQQADHLRELLRVLRPERRLDLRGERRRAEPEVPLALRREPLPQPRRRVLHPPVFGEPPRELLGCGLRLELGELGRLLREEAARLQLEERGDEDEELAAGFEIELFALGEPLEEGEHDPGHVELPQVELVLEDERQQEVERAFERVEVELELPDDHAPTVAPLPDAATRDCHLGPLRHFALFRGLRLVLGGLAQELPPDEEGRARDKAAERHPEVQALPADVRRRVDAERLLVGSEGAVVRDVEHEERGPAQLEAPVDPEQDEHPEIGR